MLLKQVTRKRISMTVRSTIPGSEFSLTSHGVTHAFRTHVHHRQLKYSTATGTGTASSSVHHRSFSHHKTYKHIMSTAETHRRTRASAAASSFNAGKKWGVAGICGVDMRYCKDSGQNSKTAKRGLVGLSDGGW